MGRSAVYFLIAGLLTVLVGYTNCSQVNFGADTESLLKLFAVDGGVLINNGAAYTNNAEVTLMMKHDSADEMYVSNDSTCQTGGKWESFAKIRTWTLPKENAEAAVYVKFREKDVNGVESDCLTDSIVHDNIAPAVTITREVPEFINKAEATVLFQATDAGSGVEFVDCQLDSKGKSTCDSAFIAASLVEGPHGVKIAAADKAGNWSLPVEDGFTVDLTPPTVTLNQMPAKIAGTKRADFQFSGADALSGISGYECKLSATAAWQNCSSPMGLDFPEGANKFIVRSLDKAGNYSLELPYDWTIDLTAPSVTITKGPNPYVNTQQAVFEFEGKDGQAPLARFECSVDGGGYFACSSPYTTNALPEGKHQFAVRGFDNANNVSMPATYAWEIDLTKPTVTIVSGPANPTKESAANFVFSATDGASGVMTIECQIDGGGYQACTSPKAYANLVNGNHTFNVRASDKAGNQSASANYSWRIDLNRPTVEIVSGPAAQTKDTLANLVFRADDGADGRVASIECRIDGVLAFSTCSSPKQYTNLSEGSHTFYVRAVDEVGLISDVKSHTWYVDSLPPAINFGKMPMPVVNYNGDAIVQFAVTDAGVGVDSVRCGLNGVLAACLATEERNLKTPVAGNYVFRVEATDKLGNMSFKEVTWKVEVRTALYNQDVNVTANNKADVLVVIDNSGSMNTEQASMAARFGTFLDQLSSLDWQVGIVTTDVSSDANKKDGRFLEISGFAGNFILNSTMNLAQAKTYFGNTIQRPASEGSGNEQGVAATYRAIQRSQEQTKVENAPNRAFFRSGAALSVLVVTDADETNPNGTQTQNMPQSLINLVSSTFGTSKPFSFHSIIVKPGDAVCRSQAGNEGYGNTYDSLSKLTGGVVGTVCSTDYGSQLTQMGRAVVDLIKSVNLTCAPIDTDGDGKGDISVMTANGSAAPGYTIDGMKVTFDVALPVGLNKLTYTCLAP